FGIAGLIHRAPDIDASDFAGRQPAGDCGQYRAPAAAHIQDGFVASQIQAVENFLPLDEFAAAGGVPEAGRTCGAEHEVEAHSQRTPSDALEKMMESTPVVSVARENTISA